VEAVKAHHPYEVPEVIGMPIVSGSKKYMNWVIESTKDPSGNEELSEQTK
jgi:periplasmic divalent cation tolerance protein